MLVTWTSPSLIQYWSIYCMILGYVITVLFYIERSYRVIPSGHDICLAQSGGIALGPTGSRMGLKPMNGAWAFLRYEIPGYSTPVLCACAATGGAVIEWEHSFNRGLIFRCVGSKILASGQAQKLFIFSQSGQDEIPFTLLSWRRRKTNGYTDAVCFIHQEDDSCFSDINHRQILLYKLEEGRNEHMKMINIFSSR